MICRERVIDEITTERWLNHPDTILDLPDHFYFPHDAELYQQIRTKQSNNWSLCNFRQLELQTSNNEEL